MWIDATKETPKLIEGKDYSPNVLAVCYGELKIMCYCWIDGVGNELGGYYWANCYGDIYGDAEWDDDYNVTHWQYLPTLPEQNNVD
jgi:hypothetical protein